MLSLSVSKLPRILAKQGNLHEYFVELKVVSTKTEVKVSFAWVANSFEYFATNFELVEVHTGPDFPSLDFAGERRFAEANRMANRVFGGFGFAMDKRYFRNFAPLR